MAVDYPGAIDRIITDPAWVFTDALKGLSGSDLSIVNHKTASNSQNSAQDEANFFHNDTRDHKSVHFVIGRDGVVVQVVKLKDGAGGNCCMEAGHDPYWSTQGFTLDAEGHTHPNVNTKTISIEHVDWTSDNSQPMTQAQIDASFKLNLWLCQTLHIPVSHIKGHSSLLPRKKAGCPGPTYPIAGLIQYVQQHLQGGTALAELPNYPLVGQRTNITSDQQPPEDAEDQCVAAAIGSAMLYYKHQSQWDNVINPDRLKDIVYGQGYVGGTAATKYVPLCDQLGFKLYSIGGSPTQLVAEAHKQIKAGRPVIFTEPSPYDPSHTWSHVCAFFGEITGGLKAMDPFPPKVVSESDAYWIGQLMFDQIWIVEPKGVYPVGVPQGWKDDGTTLTAPNGVKVTKGFRTKVLEGWNPSNYPIASEEGRNPLEDSNPSLGGGTAQQFRETLLEWTSTRGVFVAWVGVELQWARAKLAQVNADNATLRKERDALKAQLAAAPQAQATTTNEAEHHALMSVHTTLNEAYTSMNDVIEKALGGSPS
jgi:hypothetical protein